MGADPFESLLVRFTPPRGGQVLTVPAPTDLRFYRQWPGGAKNLSCTVVLPVGSALPPALARFAHVDVVDRRTGRVVWHGRLTDPGLTVSAGGLRCAVTGEGAQMVLDGWREVYGLVDRSRESWQAVGEFDPAAQSFGGDLAPGDFDFGDFDLGDYGDLIGIGDIDLGGFGGEIAIDFPFDLDLGGGFDLGDLGDLGDFGGDLGDFGGINFTGGDYPSPADYPGYLGYLQDPLGGLGDMLAIPMGGDPPGMWTGGYGTGAVDITDGIRLSAGTGRHLMPPLGVMVAGPGYFDTGFDEGDPFIFSVGEVNALFDIRINIKLVDSSSAAQVWTFADAGVSDDGFRLDIDDSGTLTVYAVVAGVATELGNFSKAITPGLTYQIKMLSMVVGYVQFAIYAPGSFPVDGSTDDTNWFNLQNDFTASLTYDDQAAGKIDGANRHFAVAATAGEVEFTDYRGRRTDAAPPGDIEE